ncbi:hypothetical protein [Paenibacillus sp. FSL P2-0173]|uniref:hypothetical protein n=1 Tax=Paenibacillus sp. FSL P2-0173 TaxID=2921627 RepID=UPI0030F5B186
MEPLLKDDAIRMLQPYIDLIKTAVSKGVQDYYIGEEYAQTRHKHSQRTAASICHDNIKDEIKLKFEGLPKVRTDERKGLFMLSIEGLLTLRFKKFNDKLLSNGITTMQALAYDLQDTVQLELEGLPPYGLLHVGYTLNNLQSNIDGIYITYRYGKINIWEWDITHEEVTPIAEPALFPLPTPSETTTRKTRVRVKDKSISAGDKNAINK